MNTNKFNMILTMQKWVSSPIGQTVMNYAYSWGAAIVILGALFKLTHLPYANLMLFIGMGTEVAVFFIAAFDTNVSNVVIGENTIAKYDAKCEETNSRESEDCSLDSEKISKTFNGILDVYEMQLKSGKATLDQMNRIEEQAKNMTESLSKLNSIYSKIIDAYNKA